MRVVLLLVALAMPAQAQMRVSAGSGIAHECYEDARTPRQPRVSIDTCTAALEHGGISAADRAATFVNRGVLYDVVKNYEAAWADYNAALHLNPDLGDAYINRGAALMRMQRSDEGIVDIRKGLALGTSLPAVALYDLAVAEENLGQIKEAYLDYKRALAADPKYAPAAEALKFFKVETTRNGKAQ